MTQIQEMLKKYPVVKIPKESGQIPKKYYDYLTEHEYNIAGSDSDDNFVYIFLKKEPFHGT